MTSLADCTRVLAHISAPWMLSIGCHSALFWLSRDQFLMVWFQSSNTYTLEGGVKFAGRYGYGHHGFQDGYAPSPPQDILQREWDWRCDDQQQFFAVSWCCELWLQRTMQDRYGVSPSEDLGISDGCGDGYTSSTSATEVVRCSNAPLCIMHAHHDGGTTGPGVSTSASSFYGSLFPRTRSSLPPIFASVGGRSDVVKAADARIRAASSFSELLDIVQECLARFDEGSLVIAFCTGAKLVGERLPSGPTWKALQEKLHQAIARLEPRGLSMVAYASAKLAWREEAFLLDLASESTKKAAHFGPTDVAKICWGFTKLEMVQQVPDFWTAMETVVQRKVQEARHVDLSMIVWAFGMAERGSPAMCAEISSTALRLMQELTPQCLANVALVFARLGIENSELFEAIQRRSLSQVPDFADFDVTSLCWAMARADAVDFELFDKLANHTVSCGFVKRYSAEMAAQMAWAFAVARVAHEPLFSELSDFIAQHASVFEAQYVANFAWAYATLDIADASAWQAVARECKGGRLWRYRPDELCAVCWGFAKIGWEDEELIGDMAQVASHRISELDTRSLINLLSAFVVLCDHRGTLDMAHCKESDVASVTFEHQEELTSVLESGLSELSSKTLQPGQELVVAVRLFCKAGRVTDACRLCCQRTDMTTWSVLLATAERSDASLAARLWDRLAEDLPEPFASAVRRCAATCQGVRMQEESSGLPATPQLEVSEQLQRLAGLLRGAEAGAGAPSKLAAGRGAQLARFTVSPQFALDIRGGEDALALAMAVRCPVWCLEDSAIVAAGLRRCAAAWAPNLEVHMGPAEFLMEKVLQRRGAGCVDLLVLHGGGEAQLEDFRRAEDLHLLSQGCQLLSVGVMLPGAPRLLWHLHAQSAYVLELLEVKHEADSRDNKGWVASCRCRGRQKQTVREVSELAALKAESERLARLSGLRAKENEVERFRRFLIDHGLCPKREGCLTLDTSMGVLEATRPFRAFLLDVDPGERGVGLEKLLMERFGDMAQFVQASVLQSSDGARNLSAHVFEELGIADTVLQAGFLRWFQDHERVADVVFPMPAEAGAGFLRPPSEPILPASQTDLPKESLWERPSDLGEMPFEDWLVWIDASGELLCYLPTVQESYDTVAQIAQTYTSVDKATKQKVLDPLLFEDLAITAALQAVVRGSLRSDDLMGNLFEDIQPKGASTSIDMNDSTPRLRSNMRSNALRAGSGEKAFLVAGSRSCSGTEVERQQCRDMPTCNHCVPQNCEFAQWGKWYDAGGCTGLCFRHRALAQPNNECGRPCSGVQEDTKPCFKRECSRKPEQDAMFGSWSEWGLCDSGQRDRHREVATQAAHGGRSVEGPLREVQPCGQGHVVDCEMNQWNAWTTCSCTCGQGWHTRDRRIIRFSANGGKPCVGSTREEHPCNEQPCNGLACQFSPWSSWAGCDGYRPFQRDRHRRVEQPGSDGAGCSGTTHEMEGCTSHGPSDCVISQWDQWSSCDKHCDGGQQVRHRKLIHPAHSGGTCPQSKMKQIRGCNTHSCHSNQNDCILSPWRSWSACTAQCEDGVRKREREVLQRAGEGGDPAAANKTASGERGIRGAAAPAAAEVGRSGEIDRFRFPQKVEENSVTQSTSLKQLRVISTDASSDAPMPGGQNGSSGPNARLPVDMASSFDIEAIKCRQIPVAGQLQAVARSGTCVKVLGLAVRYAGTGMAGSLPGMNGPTAAALASVFVSGRGLWSNTTSGTESPLSGMTDEDKTSSAWFKMPTWDGSPETWRSFDREMQWWISSLDIEATKKYNLAARWLLRQTGVVRQSGEEFSPKDLEYPTEIKTKHLDGVKIIVVPEDPLSGLTKLLKALEGINGRTASERKGELRNLFFLALQRRPGEPPADFMSRFRSVEKLGLDPLRKQLETALQSRENYEDVEQEELLDGRRVIDFCRYGYRYLTASPRVADAFRQHSGPNFSKEFMDKLVRAVELQFEDDARATATMVADEQDFVGPDGSDTQAEDAGDEAQLKSDLVIPTAVRQAVRRLRVNTGHRGPQRLARALVIAGAPMEAVIAAKQLRCSLCQERRPPKVQRPASGPREPSDQVAVDIFDSFDAAGVRYSILHAVDRPWCVIKGVSLFRMPWKSLQGVGDTGFSSMQEGAWRLFQIGGSSRNGSDGDVALALQQGNETSRGRRSRNPTTESAPAVGDLVYYWRQQKYNRRGNQSQRRLRASPTEQQASGGEWDSMVQEVVDAANRDQEWELVETQPRREADDEELAPAPAKTMAPALAGLSGPQTWKWKLFDKDKQVKCTLLFVFKLWQMEGNRGKVDDHGTWLGDWPLPTRAEYEAASKEYHWNSMNAEQKAAFTAGRTPQTVSRTSQHLLFSAAVSSCKKHKWRIGTADVKSAFLKGEKYVDGARELYVRNREAAKERWKAATMDYRRPEPLVDPRLLERDQRYSRFLNSLDREAAVLITIFRSSKESKIDVKSDAGSGET
ncbi:Hemicentin-1 [Symbiodinium microadriaticum]|uniref:Hemicentin-1 n=1 Tax=Symbiodinium microadriaticum TaxID=2951 RepID=A0A1Q9CU93_SYMMI|nr:Hemicentin-1 [Symbiodinium microadriaticum]